MKKSNLISLGIGIAIGLILGFRYGYGMKHTVRYKLDVDASDINWSEDSND